MTGALLIVAFPVLAWLWSEVGLRVTGVFSRFVSQWYTAILPLPAIQECMKMGGWKPEVPGRIPVEDCHD